MNLSLELLGSAHDIPAPEWNRLRRSTYPFLRHDFIAGLEDARCTTAESGWTPMHLCLRDGDRAIAILPAWLKSHSYGEYVFDWSWADAWQRMGLNYYPKLLTAIPFTPATGPRLLHDPGLSEAQLWQTFADLIPGVAQELQLSSWHVLFPEQTAKQALESAGLHTRQQVQFHWFNHDYQDFDDFLDGFASRKRKALRRERRRVAEQGLSVNLRPGSELTGEDWQLFHRFYQMTYAKRSGHGGYLTREFFLEVLPRLGDQVLLALADNGDEAVAGALYFRDDDTLYGRYWGCVQEYDCLHFETCYYQGIEYCIREGLKRFDPGAQGEHKIQRGFEPTITESCHWIAQAELNDAVGKFTRDEQRHIAAYQEEARGLLPFRQAED